MELKFFEEIPFFANLSREKLQIIQRSCQGRTYKKGDFIFRQGDARDGMYIIMFGEVEVTIDGKPLARLGNNDFFGEIALLPPERRSASVRVISDIFSALYLSEEAFEKFRLDLDPEIKKQILGQIRTYFKAMKKETRWIADDQKAQPQTSPTS